MIKCSRDLPGFFRNSKSVSSGRSANQLRWAVRPQFTYFSMIMYLSEWFLHKLVDLIDLNK